MKNPRVLLVAGMVVAGVVVAVLVLTLGGSGDEGDDGPRRTVRANLTLEQFTSPETGATELLISLRDRRLNTPDTTGGETSVRLRCVNATGEAAISGATEWPLLEEAGYPFPHIHQLAEKRVLRGIRGCRLTGPGIDFEGTVPGPPPAAAQ